LVRAKQAISSTTEVEEVQKEEVGIRTVASIVNRDSAKYWTGKG